MRRLVAALTLCQVVWGAYSVVGRTAIGDGVDPVIFAFVRDLCATPLLALISLAMGETDLLRGPPSLADLPKLGTLSVLMCANQLFFILGAELTTAVNAALLQPTVPVVTVALALVLGTEALAIRTAPGQLKVLGILLAVLGAVAVVAFGADPSQPAVASNLIVGNACLVINCVSDAFYLLLHKRIVDRCAPFALTTYAYAGSTVVLLIVIVLMQRFDSMAWTFSATALWCLAYAILLNSVLVYALMSWCNKNSSPTLVTSFYPLQVVASATLTAVWSGTMISNAEVVACLLVAGGLFCIVVASILQDGAAASAKMSTCQFLEA